MCGNPGVPNERRQSSSCGSAPHSGFRIERLDARAEAVKVSRQRNSSSAAQVEYAAAMTASATPAWATNAGMFLIVASQISDSVFGIPAGAFGAMNDAGRSSHGWVAFCGFLILLALFFTLSPPDTRPYQNG